MLACILILWKTRCGDCWGVVDAGLAWKDTNFGGGQFKSPSELIFCIYKYSFCVPVIAACVY